MTRWLTFVTMAVFVPGIAFAGEQYVLRFDVVDFAYEEDSDSDEPLWQKVRHSAEFVAMPGRKFSHRKTEDDETFGVKGKLEIEDGQLVQSVTVKLERQDGVNGAGTKVSLQAGQTMSLAANGIHDTARAERHFMLSVDRPVDGIQRRQGRVRKVAAPPAAVVRERIDEEVRESIRAYRRYQARQVAKEKALAELTRLAEKSLDKGETAVGDQLLYLVRANSPAPAVRQAVRPAAPTKKSLPLPGDRGPKPIRSAKSEFILRVDYAEANFDKKPRDKITVSSRSLEVPVKARSHFEKTATVEGHALTLTGKVGKPTDDPVGFLNFTFRHSSDMQSFVGPGGRGLRVGETLRGLSWNGHKKIRPCFFSLDERSTEQERLEQIEQIKIRRAALIRQMVEETRAERAAEEEAARLALNLARSLLERRETAVGKEALRIICRKRGPSLSHTKVGTEAASLLEELEADEKGRLLTF